jgi:hypothetical protein
MLMKNIIAGINQSSYYEKQNLLFYSPTPKVNVNPKMFLRTCKPIQKPSVHNSFNELELADTSIENKNFPVRKPVTYTKLNYHKKAAKHHHVITQFNYALPPSLLHEHHNNSVDNMKPTKSLNFHKAKHSPVVVNDDIRITIKYKPLKIIQKDLVDIGVGNEDDKFTLPIIPLTATHKKESRNYMFHKNATLKRVSPAEENAKQEMHKIQENTTSANTDAQTTPLPKAKMHLRKEIKEQNHSKTIPIPILNSISPINVNAKTRNTVLADPKNRRALTLRQKSFDNVELSPWSQDENV